ncbi:hypothetical protein VPNG_09687 [Cytospora leucostoma]|uniref:Uncharacterized protein n=1 Tax=Cytospora leucostoma TaxID=1230097 RepID=A0A423VJZ3_9PEZI|nr:hypothetical protein VPNG_09687 [Cytospora leucostoma]
MPPRYPPVSCTVFGILAAKGRVLHAELLESIKRRGHTYVQMPEIAPGYTTNLEPPGWAVMDYMHYAMLREAGQPSEEYVLAGSRRGGSLRRLYHGCGVAATPCGLVERALGGCECGGSVCGGGGGGGGVARFRYLEV